MKLNEANQGKCDVCKEELDNLSPGIMVVEHPYSAPLRRLTICGHCLPAMEYNGWKEIARAR